MDDIDAAVDDDACEDANTILHNPTAAYGWGQGEGGERQEILGQSPEHRVTRSRYTVRQPHKNHKKTEGCHGRAKNTQ